MKLAVVAALLMIYPLCSYAQNPILGSIPSGAVSSLPLPLTLSDAVDRGLRYNFGILSGVQEQRAATASRLHALYELYPKIKADLSSSQQQINLAAFGFGGFPGINPIIPPFALVDARVRMTQSVYDRKLLEELKEAQANEQAASLNNENTRELVVVAVANLYLQALAGASRIEAVDTQVTRAQTLYQRAIDLKNSGLVPNIDVLRAQVELQNQQQRQVAYRNDFAQQKLSLMRAIGIPLGQEVVLVDPMPVTTPPVATLEEALSAANESRADLRRAHAVEKAAQYALSSAKSENLPKLDVSADYGVIGRRPTETHGTYNITGRILVPLFNGTESKSDQERAEARLEMRRLETEDLKGRVEMEVRAAFLDLQSSEQQLSVARSSRDLARAQLDQSQDRFEAGVANNLEVIQAQETVALADENVISSLYTFNVAKARLARSMGRAEQLVKTFLGGRP